MPDPQSRRQERHRTLSTAAKMFVHPLAAADATTVVPFRAGDRDDRKGETSGTRGIGRQREQAPVVG